MEGEAPLEPGEAGHYLGTAGCANEGELAEQQEHPPDHTTRTNVDCRVQLGCFPFALELFCCKAA